MRAAGPRPSAPGSMEKIKPGIAAVLEKLRWLGFPLTLHGFALFNHNQETLFCSDYSGLRPIYAAQPHPKTLQPTHV